MKPNFFQRFNKKSSGSDRTLFFTVMETRPCFQNENIDCELQNIYLWSVSLGNLTHHKLRLVFEQHQVEH